MVSTSGSPKLLTILIPKSRRTANSVKHLVAKDTDEVKTTIGNVCWQERDVAACDAAFAQAEKLAETSGNAELMA